MLDTTIVHLLVTGMVITDMLPGRTFHASYILMDMYASWDGYGILHVDQVSGKGVRIKDPRIVFMILKS